MAPAPATSRDLLDRLSAIGAMTLAMSRATLAAEIYREALRAIAAVSGTNRAAVLLFDPDGVMRFKAWSGLSDRYRAAVEGHTPWRPGQPDPEPFLLPDPLTDPGLAPFRAVIEAEGIRSMAMVPLVAGGGTIGKFMVYADAPRAFGPEEVQLVRNVAAHSAFAIDRQRAVDALQKSEEQHRSVVEHLKEVVFQTDPEGRWTFLNPSWTEVTGFPVSESLGRPLLEFVHPDDRDRALAEHRALVQGVRQECRCEVRYVRRGGGFRWLEVYARPTRGPGGVLLGGSGTLIDVTDRKAADEALREAEVRLRDTQRLESLGVLAGGIAHDFNNLLMGVLGNASLALADLQPGAAAHAAVQDVITSARRAADLTRQLLAYSGRGKFVLERLDVSALVRESAQLLSAAISRKATLTYACAEALPAVEGDATQLRQVAMNLLANASDALGDGPGTVTVRTSLVQADRARLDRALHGSELAPGTYVLLEVQDTGSGMDGATLRRMFEPFFTTKVHGRGLGLAAVLGIVRGHQGALEVESDPGRGTSVRVLLPPARAAASARKPGADGAATALGVLLVDDEEVVRRATGRMLARDGCRVELAENGRRALAILEERRAGIDVVVLDLTMPEMSGEETLTHLRARWPDLPVVLMSGYTEGARRAAEGPTLFLPKPFAHEELQDAFRRVLASARHG